MSFIACLTFVGPAMHGCGYEHGMPHGMHATSGPSDKAGSPLDAHFKGSINEVLQTHCQVGPLTTSWGLSCRVMKIVVTEIIRHGAASVTRKQAEFQFGLNGTCLAGDRLRGPSACNVCSLQICLDSLRHCCPQSVPCNPPVALYWCSKDRQQHPSTHARADRFISIINK